MGIDSILSSLCLEALHSYFTFTTEHMVLSALRKGQAWSILAKPVSLCDARM